MRFSVYAEKAINTLLDKLELLPGIALINPPSAKSLIYQPPTQGLRLAAPPE